MPIRDLDINLTDEQKAMRDTIRKFGSEVMRPAGIELDKLDDPSEVIAEGSVLWDVYRKYREIGLHKRSIPKALGGMMEDMDIMSSILMAEEMGYWDSGLAISFGVDGMPFALAALSPDPELQSWARDYVEDTECKMTGCWAITEPDHGTDWLLRSEATNCSECVPNVRAELKGDEYILNGQKSAWVSNGTMATHANLHVSLDPSKGMAGTGLAVVRLDLPGISRGKPLDKIGQRPLNQGEIYFDDVKIPKNWMIVPDPALIEGTGEMGLARVNGGMGITFAGLARAAFDEAFKYSKERVQGGRRMALYNAANPLAPSAPPAVASKVLSTETAFQVASEAIQIFGGNGLSREYPVEKMFRDARAAMIEDGVNETLSIAATEFM
ncbi:MAG: acyl-CoA/acyl-ACP dehydrogenase [Deltaproteobacteria bacterium]|nr:acyl-CoA/acyl-ACP dehydrogenase [Deltaproteobacteria bacterium]